MKYISLETIQKARRATVSTPDALQAAYIDGWNDCIEALTTHLPPTKDEGAVSILAEKFDDIFNDDEDEDGFLQALGEKRDALKSVEGEYRAAVETLKHKDTDAIYVDYPDPGIPDCDECSFSGPLTED